MSRKKRRFEQLEAAAANPEEKKTYVDPFQQQVIPKIEGFGKKFEGRGKTILYGLGAVLVLVIIIVLFMRWNARSTGAAQTALGKAIETSQAQISATGAQPGSTQKTFKTEKERSDAAIVEFQKVVDTYGGAVGEKAKYFIAVNKLMSDRTAGITELESIAAGGSDTAKLAKFALAQTRADDNKVDEAVTLYQELGAMADPIVAKDTINFDLAKLYEKQGKKQEAADIYFNIAKAASEAKDSDGKPVRMTETATKAKERLKVLDPERSKQIVDPTPESPFGNG